MLALKVPVTDADHHQGSLQAPLILVEYGDFQSSICQQLRPFIKRLQHHYGERISFVFRHFPLTPQHDEAFNAALVAEFAAHKQEFWSVYDLLYDYQDQLGWTLYSSIASKFALSIQELDSALQRGQDEAAVKEDLQSGLLSGVNTAPTLFINGQQYQGQPDLLVMEYLLDNLLRKRSKK